VRPRSGLDRCGKSHSHWVMHGLANSKFKGNTLSLKFQNYYPVPTFLYVTVPKSLHSMSLPIYYEINLIKVFFYLLQNDSVKSVADN
jgi:hypothetical protein